MKVIHINRFLIERNAATNRADPIVRIEEGNTVSYCMEVEINGPSKVIYRPDKPWHTGAKLWIETDAELTMIGHKDMPGCG
jgi:hypothetical protein